MGKRGEPRNAAEQARQNARQIVDRYERALRAYFTAPTLDRRQRYMRARRGMIERLDRAPEPL